MALPVGLVEGFSAVVKPDTEDYWKREQQRINLGTQEQLKKVADAKGLKDFQKQIATIYGTDIDQTLQGKYKEVQSASVKKAYDIYRENGGVYDDDLNSAMQDMANTHGAYKSMSKNIEDFKNVNPNLLGQEGKFLQDKMHNGTPIDEIQKQYESNPDLSQKTLKFSANNLGIWDYSNYVHSGVDNWKELKNTAPTVTDASTKRVITNPTGQKIYEVDKVVPNEYKENQIKIGLLDNNIWADESKKHAKEIDKEWEKRVESSKGTSGVEIPPEDILDVKREILKDILMKKIQTKKVAYNISGIQPRATGSGSRGGGGGSVPKKGFYTEMQDYIPSAMNQPTAADALSSLGVPKPNGKQAFSEIALTSTQATKFNSKDLPHSYIKAYDPKSGTLYSFDEYLQMVTTPEQYKKLDALFGKNMRGNLQKERIGVIETASGNYVNSSHNMDEAEFVSDYVFTPNVEWAEKAAGKNANKLKAFKDFIAIQASNGVQLIYQQPLSNGEVTGHDDFRAGYKTSNTKTATPKTPATPAAKTTTPKAKSIAEQMKEAANKK